MIYLLVKILVVIIVLPSIFIYIFSFIGRGMPCFFQDCGSWYTTQIEIGRVMMNYWYALRIAVPRMPCPVL